MSWITDQQEVHITVGSSIHLKSGLPDLDNDMQMVKAALLYADQSKLVSVPSSTLLDLATPHEVDDLDPEAFLRNQILWNTGEDKKETEEMLELYQRAKRRRHSKRGQQALMLVKTTFAKYLRERQESAVSLISEIGAEGLVEVVASGLLQIHPFESVFDSVTRHTYDPDKIILDYISAVSSAMTDARTYPLFDEKTGRMISSEIEAGTIRVSDTGINRNNEVALAADLLARLPLFERATLKEILDIRRELEKPLIHFRAAMIKFSDQIQSASWDKDFAQDADHVLRSEITPAVLALEEEEKSNSFLNKLTSKVADKSLQVGSAVTASGMISALAVRMLNLPLADVAALAVGPAIVAGGVAYTAYKEWREKQKEIEGNSLFFYYRAGSLLEDGSFQYQNSDQPKS